MESFKPRFSCFVRIAEQVAKAKRSLKLSKIHYIYETKANNVIINMHLMLRRGRQKSPKFGQYLRVRESSAPGIENPNCPKARSAASEVKFCQLISIPIQKRSPCL